jgi:hypothetical protein
MTEHRPTDAPYGPEESAAIMKALHEHAPLVCPRCQGPLEQAPPVANQSLFTVFLVRCPRCQRAVFAGEYFKHPPQA